MVCRWARAAAASIRARCRTRCAIAAWTHPRGGLLYKRSGLLGISRLSNDLRALAQSEDPRVGENPTLIRPRVCADAGWLGVEIDHDRNERAEPRLPPDGVTPSVWVIPTDEERIIVVHTQGLVSGT